MASVPARQLFHQSHTYNWIRRARSPSSIPVRSPFRSYTTNTPPTSPTPTHATDLPKPKLRGWRKYAHQFRDKPASYIVSFAVLHELTAILPIPLVYFFLDKTGTRIPFPEDAIAEGNRIFSRLRVRYGYEPLDSQSRVMINLATSYAVVKALLPMRVALSVALTPVFAERIVGPLTGLFRQMVKRPAKS